MPELDTKFFGKLQYTAEAVFEFASGIPAFENQTAFLFVEQPHTGPLILMQSLVDPNLCFITVPVFVVDPQYRLQLSREDLSALEFAEGSAPHIGTDVTCLALVTVAEGADPTANLASPVVLNLHNRKGVQAIQDCTPYAYQHPLLAKEDVALCS